MRQTKLGLRTRERVSENSRGSTDIRRAKDFPSSGLHRKGARGCLKKKHPARLGSNSVIG